VRRSRPDENELTYLGERRLGRIATADRFGRPHVTPVGMWRYMPEENVVEITGRNFSATRKYRNVKENPQAALVIDDVASTGEWSPRAVLLEGPAEAIESPDGSAAIRISVDRVVSWGL